MKVGFIMKTNLMTREELKKRYCIGNDKVAILLSMAKFLVFKIGNEHYILSDELFKLEKIAAEKHIDISEAVA